MRNEGLSEAPRVKMRKRDCMGMGWFEVWIREKGVPAGAAGLQTPAGLLLRLGRVAASNARSRRL